MPDTFFTAPPDWTLYIVPYFFVGGIAGGMYLLAALLHWWGRSEDAPAVRIGYIGALVGCILSGFLLTLDLGRPTRFWHMLIQSERAPMPMFKLWSPMSVGAWALLLFGLCAALSAAGALGANGHRRFTSFRVFHSGLLARVISALGAALGLFIAGYTGVLLSVTNRPIWADTNLLGVLFLFSGLSTAAAALILLLRWRTKAQSQATTQWLAWFDGWALLLELVALIAFIVSLGRVAFVWVSLWGAALLILVVGAGILAPLALHFRPALLNESWRARGLVVGAVLVLVGGLMLRLVVLGASDAIHGSQAGMFR